MMHGGYIWVGKVRRVRAAPSTSCCPPGKEAANFSLPPVSDDDRPLVLVLDDDPSALQLVQDYLGPENYQVCCHFDSGAKRCKSPMNFNRQSSSPTL